MNLVACKFQQGILQSIAHLFLYPSSTYSEYFWLFSLKSANLSRFDCFVNYLTFFFFLTQIDGYVILFIDRRFFNLLVFNLQFSWHYNGYGFEESRFGLDDIFESKFFIVLHQGGSIKLLELKMHLKRAYYGFSLVRGLLIIGLLYHSFKLFFFTLLLSFECILLRVLRG